MTERELQVLRDASNDKVYKQTASTLDTTEQTVKNIACSAFRKLGVTTKHGAIAAAFRLHLID